MKPKTSKLFLRRISLPYKPHNFREKKMRMGSYLKSEVLIAKGRDDEIKYRGSGNEEQKN